MIAGRGASFNLLRISGEVLTVEALKPKVLAPLCRPNKVVPNWLVPTDSRMRVIVKFLP